MFATALLAVIPAGVSKSAPVVINLHGGGSNAEQQQRFSGTDAVADREHFIVVYPNGTGGERMRVWNAGTFLPCHPERERGTRA